MPSFINFDLEGKINTNFLLKHFSFSILWAVGISLFIFRLDIFLLERYSESLQWLKISLPTIYLIILFVYFFTLKWYYKLALIFYPILFLFWFLPKAILSKGKIYLLGKYLEGLFIRLKHFKRTLIHLAIFILTVISYFSVDSIWVRWFAIFVITYFYLRYVLRVIRSSFDQPMLFTDSIAKKLTEYIKGKDVKNSLIIKSYVIQEKDSKLSDDEKRDTQKRRGVLAMIALEIAAEKLNGFKGRQAFIISWLIGAFNFLILSIIFFWFINMQLYKIDTDNFSYAGAWAPFDFLYYTLKTITFGDIDLVKPVSVVARISEVMSFFTIGIFFLVIIVSIFLSLHQERVRENMKTTVQLFKIENENLAKYFIEEFGMEIKAALIEIKNIDESIKRFKKIIDKLF